MLHELISRNADLKQLWDDGYEVEIVTGTHLVIHNIPYVGSDDQVKRGLLVTALQLNADNTTASPLTDHTVHFVGEHPHDHEGNQLTSLVNSSSNTPLVGDLVSNHTFSHKAPSGYTDYHAKMSRYIEILTGYAQAIDQSVSGRTFRRIEPGDTETVFNYPDMNSSRADISHQAQKLDSQLVAIVGLGGTGSYVLDFVSKTPVSEIHLYDDDLFSVHNAYRAPGAAQADILQARPSKVGYHAQNYSAMHRKIIKHAERVTSRNVSALESYDFVFLCMDSGPDKQLIIEKLIELEVPFVDTGVGMQVTDGKLRGSARTTFATAEYHQHLKKRISYATNADDYYDKNIQIAEINALNAAMAVIKWKQHAGYFHDLVHAHHLTYNIDDGKLFNEDLDS